MTITLPQTFPVAIRIFEYSCNYLTTKSLQELHHMWNEEEY